MYQPEYHRKPAGQVIVQTFHGYPFKGMGTRTGQNLQFSQAAIESYDERPATGTTWSRRRATPRRCCRATSTTRARCSRSATRATTCCSAEEAADPRAGPARRSASTTTRRRSSTRRRSATTWPATTPCRDGATSSTSEAATDALGDDYVLLVRGPRVQRPGRAHRVGRRPGHRRHRLPRGRRPVPGLRRRGPRLLLAALRLRRHRQADGLPRAGPAALQGHPRLAVRLRADRPRAAGRHHRPRWSTGCATSTACGATTPRRTRVPRRTTSTSRTDAPGSASWTPCSCRAGTPHPPDTAGSSRDGVDLLIASDQTQQIKRTTTTSAAAEVPGRRPPRQANDRWLRAGPRPQRHQHHRRRTRQAASKSPRRSRGTTPTRGAFRAPLGRRLPP